MEKRYGKSLYSGHFPKISHGGQGQMAKYMSGRIKLPFAEHRKTTRRHRRLVGPLITPLSQILSICTRIAAPLWDLQRYGALYIKANRCVTLHLKYIAEKLITTNADFTKLNTFIENCYWANIINRSETLESATENFMSKFLSNI